MSSNASLVDRKSKQVFSHDSVIRQCVNHFFLYLKEYVVSSEEEEHSETYDTEDPSDVSGRSGLRAAIDSAKEDIIISIDYYADKYVARAKRYANNAMEALYQDLEKKY